MSRCAGHDGDKDNQPTDLEVKKREFVQAWDELVTKEYNRGCQKVETLVDHEDFPCFDDHARVVKSD